MLENNTTQTERKNPFFEPYNTPHDTVPFNRIEIGDYEEAFLEGIRRDDEEIEKLVNDPEAPTFENTIVRVDNENGENYYDLLSRVSTVFSCMMSPILTKHANDVKLNKRLFERIKYVYENHRELTAEEQMLLDNCYDGFVRSGALLDDEGKERLRNLTEEASLLSLQFSQNLLKENKAFTLHITDEAQLDGLPETAREAAALAAKEADKEGWLFTLDYPSYSPFMTYSTQRELRRQLYMARNTEGTHDNTENNLEICKRLINLRREIAQLLGYETYADYVLVHRMASNAENVYKLLNDLIDAYRPTAVEEVKALEREAKQTEGDDFVMEPWDFSFYSHKLQMREYNLDAEMLRPYFELSKVIDGVFGLATRLYGITFKENKDIQVYHPDVTAYDVTDENGRFMAVLYLDFFPRESKRSGAWMTEFRGAKIVDGKETRPLVSLVMNFTKPTETAPSLLTFDEVETFLHEFGHSLHGMLGEGKYESQTGTSVYRDFVELPSQIMENWATEKEFLDLWAVHYETGEPMPAEIVDRIVAAQNYLAAYSNVRQLSFGLTDMAWHTITEPFEGDVEQFEVASMAPTQVLPVVPGTAMAPAFGHIFSGGYAAGYYGYKWAEVLEADAFSLFKEKGIFNREVSGSFRENILSKGGTEHPMELYVRFRGHKPETRALIEKMGLGK